eukprot:9010154-Pyramimonas_sp.AAC.1
MSVLIQILAVGRHCLRGLVLDVPQVRCGSDSPLQAALAHLDRPPGLKPPRRPRSARRRRSSP